MAERIRQLEEALALSHAKTSADPHALLVPGAGALLEEAAASGLVGERPGDAHDSASSQNNDVIDAFGTLSIGSDGRSKYHNQSAGADVSPPQSSFAPSHLRRPDAVFCRGTLTASACARAAPC